MSNTNQNDQKRKPNCLCIYYVTHPTLDSGNGGWSEGNIITRKRFTAPDGTQYPYWSGQCVRRMIRNYWDNNGENVSPVSKKGKVTTSSCNPNEYLDDDFFGYMDEEKAKLSRTGPVRVSPLIGCFKFRSDDRDLGINSGECNKDNNIFETEQTYNAYYGCALIEIDRLGEFKKDEGEVKDDKSLNNEQKKARLNCLIEAIENLWGGGKQGRLLSNVSPQFIVATLQYGKNPFLLGLLKLDNSYNISNGEGIAKLLVARKKHISDVLVGYTPGVANGDKVADLICAQSDKEVPLCRTKHIVGEITEALTKIVSTKLEWSGNKNENA